MTTRRLNAGERAFVASYAAHRSVQMAAADAKFPPREGVSMGVELLGRLDIQRAILARMPDARDRADFAARWGLEIDGTIPPVVTLADRIQAARERLAADVPSTIVVHRPPPTPARLRRAEALAREQVAS